MPAEEAVGEGANQVHIGEEFVLAESLQDCFSR